MYLNKKVDLLVTYVNFKDPKWRADYESVTHTKLNEDMMERYRSFGTLRYLFRGIDKFMPYIDRVILIVSNESQVPKWLDKSKIRVLTHAEYIPTLYLPTFNSCTIEANFHRIEGLNPYIIYTNDDIYPIQLSSIEDFFTNGLPNTNYKFYKGFNRQNLFRMQCKNGADLIFNTLKRKRLIDENTVNPTFFKPDHCMSAFIKENLKLVGYLCGEELRKSCTPFRSFKNVNQHVYLYYQYFAEKCNLKKIDYEYLTFNNGIHEVCDHIVNPSHKFICINDDGVGGNYEYVKTELQKALRTILPDKCKFEV